MFIRKTVAGFRPVILTALFALALTPWSSYGGIPFQLEKDPSSGWIKPFKVVKLPLPEFIREYVRMSSAQIAWDRDVEGTVTLFLRHPLKSEELTELFHRVLDENGFAVVDAPAGNGWVIARQRYARDLSLPVYETSEVPDTARLVTAFHTLKYADAESVARTIRSFMPAGSRIIPAYRSQLFITDTGSNIRKLRVIFARIDTPEAAKKLSESHAAYSSGQPRACGEVRIEKLVVEKLEVQGNGNVSSNGLNPQVKPPVQGVKK